MFDDLPVRTDVPPTLHPLILSPEVDALDIDKSVGSRALAAGREALSTIYRTFGDIETAEKELRAEAGEHPQADRAKQLATAAEAAFKRAAAVVNRRVEELLRHQETLAGRVAEALEDPERRTREGLSIATAIRAHVQSLEGETTRIRFLTNAVDAGDRRTVSAVLAAPAYLSGLTDQHVAILRTAAAAKFAPQDSKQLDAVGKVLDRVMAGGSRFAERYAAVPQPSVRQDKVIKCLEHLAKGGEQ